jgi:hypothetical protein
MNDQTNTWERTTVNIQVGGVEKLLSAAFLLFISTIED